jgi:hypothetical protein
MIKNIIPFVDLREKTPIDLLRIYPDKATDTIKAAANSYGLVSRGLSKILLPWMDKKSHAWLKFSYNPYLYEIETFAEILESPGVFALNMSYEWACTTGAYRTNETVSMLRVLDWPFATLGKQMVVTQQKGKAGAFYNVTWPGISGVFTAMAPGRFSAAINLAPSRQHGLGHIGDWFKNRILMEHEEGLPPSHLLRRVFEQAENYTDAKRMLSETPLCMPVIFTLAGMEQGEGCIIERLERQVQVRELHADQQLSTSNHFNTSLALEGKGWRPREVDSQGRFTQSCAIHGYDLTARDFDWLRAPMINKDTRVCVIADAKSSRLMVQGFEGMTKVTEIFNLPEETFSDFMEVV